MYRLTINRYGAEEETQEFRAQLAARHALQDMAYKLWPTKHYTQAPEREKDWEEYFGTLDATDEFARAQAELDEKRNR